MTVTIEERYDSLSTTDAESVERLYIIRGTESETDALAALKAEAPETYNGLVRKRCRVEPEGGDIWLGTAPYRRPGSTKKDPLVVGGSSYNFDTGGGTQHITQSISTISKYAQTGETAPDFKGAIGFNGKTVEGVDITVPVFTWSETHVKTPAQVTQTYALTLFDLTGKVCDDAFRGFAAGEVVFLGAAGSRRGDDNWEITFKFAASLNKENMTVGDITGIDKKGWEYLWVLYDNEEDATAKAIVKTPVATYVEKVYEDGDFDGLAIEEPSWS